MTHHGTGRRLRLAAGAAALALLMTGCATGAGEPVPASTVPASPSSVAPPAAPDTAPTDTAPTDTAPTDTSPTGAPDPAADAPAALDASAPVRIRIDELGLDAELIETGMREDRTLEVPPGYEGAPASWYDGSPTPGETGTSVLLGQVNSEVDESGVFYGLESLQGGEQVAVAREDGSTAVFEIYRVETFAKDAFPTREIYYPASTPEVRLITCHGDGEPGSYPNNLIVFAKLVSAA